MRRAVTILGATGSVGRSVLDVVAEHPNRFEIAALVGGRDAEALARVARATGARFAALADAGQGAELSDRLAGSGIANGAGPGAVADAVDRDSDILVSAITGAAGLEATYRALTPGRVVALANKESLVCAGELVMRRAAAVGARILPLDSEHNALHQALGSHSQDDIATMVLTASGGPFRTWSAERIACASREQALAHPNWVMGSKITIDSASMMNKGLELIEAHHLFGLSAGQLEVLVHPQSIVHGLVRFRDGSVIAGMAQPDMRVPVAHCLGLDGRLEAPAERHLDLSAIGTLTFEAPDLARFPALRLALAALRAGGAMPAVLNAANEIAVAAFLAGRIRFGSIAALVEEVCTAQGPDAGKAPGDVADALAVNAVARNHAEGLLSNGRFAVTSR